MNLRPRLLVAGELDAATLLAGFGRSITMAEELRVELMAYGAVERPCLSVPGERLPAMMPPTDEPAPRNRHERRRQAARERGSA